MERYKYPIKDKKIRIFEIVLEEDEEGYTVNRKKYLTKGTINAYINSSASPEILENGKTTYQSYINVVINKKNIDSTMYIEFRNKTYQIQFVDEFEFYNAELNIRAKEISNLRLEEFKDE